MSKGIISEIGLIKLSASQIARRKSFQTVKLNNLKEIFPDNLNRVVISQKKQLISLKLLKETEYKHVYIASFKGVQVYCGYINFQISKKEFQLEVKFDSLCRPLARWVDEKLMDKNLEPVNVLKKK